MAGTDVNFRDKKINYSLDNISSVLKSLDNPELGMKYIHVAGTNGKGSTCAFLDSILSAVGFRVGRFTSPFLVSEDESIRVAGKKIPTGELRRLAKKITAVSAAAGTSLTGFETLAVAAFLYFKARNCDISIIEAGMGGRNDATNVIIPVVSVICGVAMDHVEYLGPALADIAFEKASIAKKGVPLVANVKDENIKKTVLDTAAKLGASRVIFVDSASSGRLVFSGPGGLKFYAAAGNFSEKLYRTKLTGDYQFENAKTALCAIDALNSIMAPCAVQAEAVERGFKSARWPARFEVIKKAGRTFVVDGAHNLEGMTAFAAGFKKIFPGRRAFVITGILKNKEYERMLEIMLEIASDAALCDFESRGEKNGTAHLAAYLKGRIADPAVYNHYEDAVKDVFAKSRPGDIICVTGSLYLAGPAGFYIRSKRFTENCVKATL